MMRPLAAGNEHTAGILVLQKHSTHVEAWMKHSSMPFFHHHLNDKWSAFFIKDEKIEQPETFDTLIELSKFVSLLHFFHAEDWGWGYRVFINGFEEASFYDDYHFDHTMALELAKQRYPDIEDILYFLYFDKEGRSLLDSLVEEVNNTREYLEQQFGKKNIDAFATFEVDDATLDYLDDLISFERLRDQRLHWRHVEDFKERLGFPELNRMNFRYLFNIFGKAALQGSGAIE
jgi:hypothetical protein